MLKNGARVRAATILPHPNPLPLGEGTAIKHHQFSNGRSANSDWGNFKNQPRILPLPAGEGRGEGEGLDRLPRPGSEEISRGPITPAAHVV